VIWISNPPKVTSPVIALRKPIEAISPYILGDHCSSNHRRWQIRAAFVIETVFEPKSGSWGDCPMAESAHLMGMSTTLSTLLPHPEGEQPSVEEFSATAETFAGRVHVEWDSDGLVTPLGQLPLLRSSV